MSRFDNYVNENIGHYLDDMTDDIRKLIEKDCKKYLKLVKNTGPFYRAIWNKLRYGEILKKKVRQDRQPKGTSNINFKRLNKWLEKNGHMRRDKSVSVTSSEKNASEFGIPSDFYPIGNFSYSWIKAQDLNLDDESTGWVQSNIDYFFDSDSEFELEMDDEDRKNFPKWFTTNKGIEIAHRNKYEVWFNCKEYYLTGVP